MVRIRSSGNLKRVNFNEVESFRFLLIQMKKLKYILRGILLISTILLLVYLNKKTDDHTQTIAQFKYKMIEKIRTDSLDSKQKANLLLNETTKFIDDSSHVKKGIRNLMSLLGIWFVIELVFLIQEKRNTDRPEFK
jgi:hypothetical protein